MSKTVNNMTEKSNQLSVCGFTAPGFEKVADTFRLNLLSGLEQGGSFAAYYQGKLVVNLWGGYSDIGTRRLWKEDTLSAFFSTTKAVAAIVIAHLVDRGLIDYKKPVSLYWPKFAQNGKEAITVEQLISNQAGLITLDQPFWLTEIKTNAVQFGEKLAAQRPFWTPGEKIGYHPLTFGLYLDQIVRHVDSNHRSLAEYFAQEIAEPFDIKLYIGLPKEMHHRATRVRHIKKINREEILKTFKGDINMFVLTASNPQDFRTTLKINDPDNRELPIPSTHGYATAASMAKLFGILSNGGLLDGKRLLSEELIHKFTQLISAGIDITTGMDAAWSVGTQLCQVVSGNKILVPIFGHGGYGGQYSAADITYRIGFAYTTCFLDPVSSYTENGDERLFSLFNSLYDCVYKLENVNEDRQVFRLHSKFQKYLQETKNVSKL